MVLHKMVALALSRVTYLASVSLNHHPIASKIASKILENPQRRRYNVKDGPELDGWCTESQLHIVNKQNLQT